MWACCGRGPWDAPRVVAWVLRGRAHLKRQLAERAAPDVRTLPYRDEVVAYLRRRRDEGRRLVLATAAEERLALAVAEHLGLTGLNRFLAFDEATGVLECEAGVSLAKIFQHLLPRCWSRASSRAITGRLRTWTRLWLASSLDRSVEMLGNDK